MQDSCIDWFHPHSVALTAVEVWAAFLLPLKEVFVGVVVTLNDAKTYEVKWRFEELKCFRKSLLLQIFSCSFCSFSVQFSQCLKQDFRFTNTISKIPCNNLLKDQTQEVLKNLQFVPNKFYQLFLDRSLHFCAESCVWIHGKEMSLHYHCWQLFLEGDWFSLLQNTHCYTNKYRKTKCYWTDFE